MADVGRELADRELRKLERKLSHEYAQAEKELRKKYEAFLKEYSKEFKRKWKLVQEGKLSEQKFSNWLTKQSLYNSWANDMIRRMTDEQVNVNKRAAELINGFMPKAYAESFNYGTYVIETLSGENTSFTLYNVDAVSRLLKDNPKLLPKASIDIAKDRKWNQQHIRSALTQSILQGDGVAKTADRLLKAGMKSIKPEDIKGWEKMSPEKLAKEVERRNKNAAIRNARTMMTGAENAGRLDSYIRAYEKYGIKSKKMWSATMDNRTRDSHARLDGEIVDLKEKFSNGLMYPGDPDGTPGEVYNCRCRLSMQLDGFERRNRHVVNGEPVSMWDYLKWKVKKLFGFKGVTGETRKARNRFELKAKAGEYNKNLRTFFGHQGRWNGVVKVDEARTDSSGRMLNDGSILLSPYASNTIIAHEITHSYSTYEFDSVTLDELGLRFVEEATTSYFSENYVKSIDGKAGKAYPKLTERLYVLNKALHLADTDYDFAKELIKVPIQQRHNYLKSKAISALKKKGATSEQLRELEKYIDEIKDGLGYA